MLLPVVAGEGAAVLHQRRVLEHEPAAADAGRVAAALDVDQQRRVVQLLLALCFVSALQRSPASDV